MSGEGGLETGRGVGEKHKLVHYQQVGWIWWKLLWSEKNWPFFVHQKHNWDCGLSCVLMVLPYRDRCWHFVKWSHKPLNDTNIIQHEVHGGVKWCFRTIKDFFPSGLVSWTIYQASFSKRALERAHGRLISATFSTGDSILTPLVWMWRHKDVIGLNVEWIFTMVFVRFNLDFLYTTITMGVDPGYVKENFYDKVNTMQVLAMVSMYKEIKVWFVISLPRRF